MKSILIFGIWTISTITVLCSACNKTKMGGRTTGGSTGDSIITPKQPPDTTKTIYVKVVEYNTGAPIANASIKLKPNYPNLETVSLSTSQSGICSFITSTKKFSSPSITKAGYWDLNDEFGNYGPVLYSPDSSIYNPAASFYASDGFLVKLFPKYTVIIHLKDSSHLPAIERCGAWFTNSGLFTVNGTEYSTGYSSSIRLYSSIDTTFQYAVFGNAVNEFSVWASFDDDCFISVPFYNVRYLITGNNMTYDITY